MAHGDPLGSLASAMRLGLIKTFLILGNTSSLKYCSSLLLMFIFAKCQFTFSRLEYIFIHVLLGYSLLFLILSSRISFIMNITLWSRDSLYSKFDQVLFALVAISGRFKAVCL